MDLANLVVRITGDISDLRERLGSVQQYLERASKSFENTGKALSKAFTIPLAAVGTAAFAAGLKIDEALDQIAINTGATGKRLESLQESFRNVAKEVPSDFKEVSNVIADLYTRLGLTGKPLEELATQILQASNMMKVAPEELERGLSRVIKSWNISVKEAGNALDILFAASQKTGIGINSLADSLTSFGPILRQLGFNFEESVAILGTFEKEGVDISQGIFGLRMAIAKFAKMGRDPAEGFKTLINSIKKAETPLKATTLAIEYFGARAGPVLASAIRSGRFEIDNLTKALKNSKGAVQLAVSNTWGFAEAWEVFKNRAMLALEPLGNQLLKLAEGYLPKLVSILDRLFNVFNSMPESTKNFVITLGLVLAVLGPVTMGIGSFISTIIGLGKAITSIVSTIGMLSKALPALIPLFTSPAGIILAIVAAAAVATILLVKNWDKISKKMKQIKDIIIAGWFDAGNRLKKSWETISDSAITIWTGIAAALASGSNRSISQIVTVWRKLSDWFVSLWQQILAPAGSIWGKILETWNKAWDQIKAWFENVKKAIEDWINSILSILSKVVNVFITFKLFWEIIPDIQDVINEIGEWIYNSLQSLQDIFYPLTIFINAIPDYIPDLYQDIVDWLRDIIDAIEKEIWDIWVVINAIPYYLSDLYQDIIDWIQGIVDAIEKEAKDIWITINAIPYYLSDLYQDVIDWVTNIVKDIETYPWDIWVKIAAIPDYVSDLYQDIYDWVTGIIGDIETEVWDIWIRVSAIPDYLSDLYQDIVDWIQSIVDAIEKEAKDIWVRINAIPDYVSDIYQDIVSWLTGIVEDIEAETKTIWIRINAIPDYLSDLYQDIADWIKGIVDAIEKEERSVIVKIKPIINSIRSIVDAISEWWGQVKPAETLQNWLNANILDLITSIKLRFNLLQGELRQVFGEWWNSIRENVTATLQSLLDIGSAFLNLFATIALGFHLAWDLLKDTFTTWWNGAKTLVVTALQDLLDLQNMYLNLFATIKLAFHLDWDSLGQTFTTWWNAAVSSVTSSLQKLLTSIALTLTIRLNPDIIPESIERIKNSLKNFVTEAGNLWNQLASNLSGKTENMSNSIINAFKNLNNTTASIVTALAFTILSTFLGLSNDLVGHSVIPDMIRDIIGEFNKMGSIISSITEQIKSGNIRDWQSLLQAINTAVTNWSSNVIEKFKTLKVDVEQVMRDLGAKISSIFSSALSDAILALSTGQGSIEDVLKNMVGQLVNAIIDAIFVAFIMPALADALAALAASLGPVGAIIAALLAIWGLVELYKWLNQKIQEKKAQEENIQQSIQDAENVADKISDLMSKPMEIAGVDILQGIKDPISSILQTIRDTTGNILGNIGSFITNLLGGIKDISIRMLGEIGSALTSILQGIANTVKGITSMIVSIAQTLGSIITGILQGIGNVITAILQGIVSVITAILQGISYLLSPLSGLFGITIPSFTPAPVNTITTVPATTSSEPIVINIYGNYIMSDNDVEELGEKLVRILRMKGVKV